MDPRVKQVIKRGVKKALGRKGGERVRRVLQSAQNVLPREERQLVDVCFINGCGPSVPHPPRYRVTHQREQLEAFCLSTSEVFYTQVDEDTVRFAQAFVIFRCPYTEAVGRLIAAAKQQGKPVYYDVDDLVIDTCYTDLIPYVQGLAPEEKKNYDSFVLSMGRTLRLCDGAITSTQALAAELRRYVPEVFVNENTASEEMWHYAEEAFRLCAANDRAAVPLGRRDPDIPAREIGELRIGYFSGSITHNADVALILPALVSLLAKNPKLRLFVVGELDLPAALQPYRRQIRVFPFVNWRLLPRLIAAVDINLAPLEDSIFNRAKSANKWVEASLVRTVTVASRAGEFAAKIEDGKTGFLCGDAAEDWVRTVQRVLMDADLRRRVGEAAYALAKEKYLTLSAASQLAGYVRAKLPRTAALVLPSTGISGGILVALQHAVFLRQAGYVVTILASEDADHTASSEMTACGERFPVVVWPGTEVRARFDKAIATMWTTVAFLEQHAAIGERYYLVQNYETDFYPPTINFRILANRTYGMDARFLRYVTISQWCARWLTEQFAQRPVYVPNGIDPARFPARDRGDFAGRKIRILIEGDSAFAYKGVDDSFRIANALDKERYEVWYMSYNKGPKDWYRVDRFLHAVPHEQVGEVYAACDILIKSSTLESFSYPPLEMMATGGFVVAVPNDGNAEYLRDGENCLLYPAGDTKAGLSCVERLVGDAALRDRLLSHYEETIAPRHWGRLRGAILAAYGAEQGKNEKRG